jgi:hypothetical protein
MCALQSLRLNLRGFLYTNKKMVKLVKFLCYNKSKDKNIKLKYRIALLIFTTLFYTAFIVLLVILIIKINAAFITILLIGITVLIAYIIINLWIKVYKDRVFFKNHDIL